MFKFPLVETNNIDYQIEFSHINTDVPAGAWKKENIIIKNI